MYVGGGSGAASPVCVRPPIAIYPGVRATRCLSARCNAFATWPGPMGTRSIGLVGILGGLPVGQAGVLDFLADFRGGAGLGMNA